MILSCFLLTIIYIFPHDLHVLISIISHLFMVESKCVKNLMHDGEVPSTSATDGDALCRVTVEAHVGVTSEMCNLLSLRIDLRSLSHTLQGR